MVSDGAIDLLIVWQKAMALARKIYTISQNFPRDELYGITSQLRRCSVSIPANIAEGYGRYSPQDNRRFLRIANGSLYELQTLVERKSSAAPHLHTVATPGIEGL